MFGTIITANDIEQVLTVITFPENSKIGDRQCIDVMAMTDTIQEPDEHLFLVLFTLPIELSHFEIDESKRFTLLTIKNSKL